jgi:hypothetical protein
MNNFSVIIIEKNLKLRIFETNEVREIFIIKMKDFDFYNEDVHDSNLRPLLPRTSMTVI